MSNEWFYQVMGEERGPVTPAQLKQLASRGNVTTDTLVRSSDHPAWVLADRVQGLFNQPPPLPETVPPPPVQLPPAALESVPIAASVVTGPNGLLKKRPRPAQKRDYLDSLRYFFDPMFERYLTPLIIRITWGLVLLGSVLALCFFGYSHAAVLASVEPDQSGVRAAENELAFRTEMLEEMRRARNPRQEPQREQPRAEPRPPATRPESRRAAAPVDPLKEMELAVASAKENLERTKAAAPTKWRTRFLGVPSNL